MWPAPGFVRRAGRSLVFFSRELRIKFLLVWVDLSRSCGLVNRTDWYCSRDVYRVFHRHGLAASGTFDKFCILE
jgi:hypothetical protein